MMKRSTYIRPDRGDASLRLIFVVVVSLVILAVGLVAVLVEMMRGLFA